VSFFTSRRRATVPTSTTISQGCPDNDVWSEVTLLELDRGLDDEVAPFVTRGTDARRGFRAFIAPSSPTATARLRRWVAAGTHLLLTSSPDGEASLHGPTRTVSGLQLNVDAPNGLRPRGHRLAR
jgi:hypothetical protein